MTNRAAARRRLVRRFISRRKIGSQHELVDLLAGEGHHVTQATVSRDLDAIGAVKYSDGEEARYTLPQREPAAAELEALHRALAEFVEVIVPSGNLVILRTPPGAAHVVAGAIDGAGLEGAIGTVAGDDTVLAVADEGFGGWRLAKELERMGAGR